MLTVNGQCFLMIPNPENKRVLLPGTVQSLDGNNVAVQFSEEVSASSNAEVVLFAEVNGKLHQQGAVVTGNASSGKSPTLKFQTRGEVTNCETRGSYRVSVASQEVTLTVDKQINCLLVDISPEGLSVITPQPLQVGSTATISLMVDAIYTQGTVRVQSEKKLPSGKLRYGLLAPDKKSQVRKSLYAVSSLMQRRQLRRLAVAA